mmetsp:Transcript_115829/g.369584  ORF Transcript_115829/g.369584 Transcript_115829/m.369584 type:complete len:117 (-) Transcript_115829:99-449(-)
MTDMARPLCRPDYFSPLEPSAPGRGQEFLEAGRPPQVLISGERPPRASVPGVLHFSGRETKARYLGGCQQHFLERRALRMQRRDRSNCTWVNLDTGQLQHHQLTRIGRVIVRRGVR